MLNDAVNRHIELYRSMGFKYKVQAYMLHSFADFAQGRSEEFVQTDSVLEWAASAPSVRQRHDRLLTVRRLACALNAEDKRHQVPPTDFFGRARKSRRTCHIFTRDEIDRLLRAASHLPPIGSMRPVTYTALLSLIVCTGLRVSEALKLELSDLTEDGLLIRATKFQKNRLVPLHESAWCELQHYVTALFLNARGDVMTRSGFEYILEKHVRTAGAKQASLVKKRVSPHSLRHSCAMLTLQATGDIRKVSLWLGHATLQSTEIYLRADPTEKLEAMASLVPPTLRRGHFRPPDKLLAMLRPKK